MFSLVWAQVQYKFCMTVLIIMTGKYREGDEKSIDPPPYCVCENFAEAVELILSQQCHVSVLY